MLHSAGRTAGEPARPVLPAWLRLLIYLPTAAALLLLGLIVAGVTVIDTSAGPAGKGPAAALSAADITFVAYGQFLLVAPFTLWFARRYDCRTWDEIGLAFRPRTPRDLLLGGALGVAVAGVWSGGLIALGLMSVHRTGDSVAEAVVYGLLSCTAVGFGEEVIFRGYLLPNLARVVGRTGAVGLSAVLFWAYHLTAPYAAEPLNAVGLVLLGVLFGLCYLATGSLWLPISLHTAYDFVYVGVFRTPPPNNLPGILSREFHSPYWVIGDAERTGVAGVVFLTLVVVAFYWWLYRPARLAEEGLRAWGPTRTSDTA
jgi:membrane protease YdiL (CAAX protease family)